MKIIKYLLFLALIIIIGGAVYFGTKDGDYDVQDTAVIDAPAEVIFNKVNDYRTWEKWGPWKKEDSTIVFNYPEKTSGEGASYAWDGEMSGSMTTTKVIPNNAIEQELTLNVPGGESKSMVYWKFDSIDNNKTKVIWGMKGKHSFMEKVYLSMSNSDFNAQIHEMNQTGLSGIAENVSEDMMQYNIHVDGETQYGGGYYMYVTTASKKSQILDKTEAMISQVERYVEENRLNKAGKPFIIYNNIDTGTGNVIFSACVPIKEKVITPESSPVVCGFMENTNTLKTTLKGNYTFLPEAYVKANEYISKNNLYPDPSESIFEVYSLQPEDLPNPAEWVTEIYIPLLTQPLPLDILNQL